MKSRSLLFLCGIGFFLFSQKATAQITLNDFLLTAFEDQALSVYDAQKEFLRPSSYRLPIINELELRMANDELAYEDLQYAVRINPGNPWQIRRNNALFNATKKELSLRKQLEFKEILLERYELALNYIYSSELSNLTNKELRLAQQKTAIFEEHFESGLFDAGDFVESKLDQIDGVRSLDAALIEVAQNRTEIELILKNVDFDWTSFPLITVSQIDSISNILVTSSFSSAELDLIAQRLEVAKQEVRLERADFGLGFVQAEYAPFRNNKNSEIGFSAGITIPIFRDNKPQIAERKLDEIELKNDFERLQRRDSVDKILEYEHLKNLIYHHEKIEAQVNKLNLGALVENLTRSENFDPLPIIKLEEGILNIEELLLKSKRRVLEQYLDFLFTFDALTHQPLVNYFSNELEEIK